MASMVPPTALYRWSNVNAEKNTRMNKSALLLNSVEVQLAKDLPRYVTGALKTFNINKRLTSQGIKAKQIHRILESSIKKALQVQDASINPAEQCGHFPRKILNILFRQNIKNYNPFIMVLQQLEQITISDTQKDEISRLCYIGLARNYFQARKYYLMPHYSRVGILTRTYMVDIMRQITQKKYQNQPSTIFLNINQTALSFNPYYRPKQLQQHITKRKFHEIITSINRIIVDQYEKYKKGNFQFVSQNLTYSETFVYLVLCVVVGAVLVWGKQENTGGWTAGGGTGILGSQMFFSCLLLLVVFVVTVGGMAISWYQCKKRLDTVCAPQNMNNKIQTRLKQYLSKVSNQTLTWKLGPDFYWIQIQDIKIKQRKTKDGVDKC